LQPTKPTTVSGVPLYSDKQGIRVAAAAWCCDDRTARAQNALQTLTPKGTCATDARPNA